MAATWVVAGLVCAVAFIISGLVILGWACVAGGAYGGWCVLAKRNDIQGFALSKAVPKHTKK